MAQFRKDTYQYLGDNKTLFEVVMIADQYGNMVGPSNPSGMAVDGFGRARSSEPITLFDSFFRFGDNGLFATSNTSTATYGFVANTSSVNLNVDTTLNAEVIRESKKVFAYQPGKSLQILTTFVMNAAKTGLRQRVGYFGAENGVFLERSGNTVAFVMRSKVTGSIVDTPVTQANWNIDPMDGNGPSHIVLDLDNPQILFLDVEWLGVGSVRAGFVINGQLIHCHTFHHANLSTAPKGAYMQTACLPLRYEIKNTTATLSSSTFKQVCATVISEGGYELTGKQFSYGQEPDAASQYRLETIGTYYPVLSFRLNPDRADAIVVPEDLSVMPINNGFYRVKIVKGGTLTGGTWANVTGTSVQYNTNATATNSGGDTIWTEYISATTQASNVLNLGKNLFKYQLERNSLANTMVEFTVLMNCSAATANVVAAMTWSEVTL